MFKTALPFRSVATGRQAGNRLKAFRINNNEGSPSQESNRGFHMSARLLLLLSLALVSCRHDPWVLSSAPQGPLEPTSYGVPSCSSFLAELDAMSLKELKTENDKIQKHLADKKSEDYPRASLIAGIYQVKNKNYPRAIELLSPLANRKALDETCRLSVKIYGDLLADLSKIEKDLAEEKKLKAGLERKLKALSDIEKEMSRRDIKTNGL